MYTSNLSCFDYDIVSFVYPFSAYELNTICKHSPSTMCLMLPVNVKDTYFQPFSITTNKLTIKSVV